ncbi:hypothetical protein E3T23_14775 [Cryobacterium cheniae]|uniref:Transmembrane protein n=1 Tax=Cryobacterium cheniae TaxID=1259262 RepID=A0A4R8XLN1_9MICO|nr:hypothetical protein [Cryobacterium cheniae]TFC75809.1 hypothetical protein E3T23_14775 [Cryobacterium cheniae]
MSRMNVFALVIDQFRFLRHVGTGKPAILVRLFLIAVAPIAGAISLRLGWQLNSVSELSAALGLLAGVFISAFALVFSLRLNLARRPTSNLKQRASRLMDESALTLLTAGLVAGTDAIWVTVVSAANDTDTPVSVWPTAITVALSALVAAYFLLAVRRLHVLYVDTFPPFWKVQALAGGAGTAMDLEEAARRVAIRNRT